MLFYLFAPWSGWQVGVQTHSNDQTVPESEELVACGELGASEVADPDCAPYRRWIAEQVTFPWAEGARPKTIIVVRRGLERTPLPTDVDLGYGFKGKVLERGGSAGRTTVRIEITASTGLPEVGDVVEIPLQHLPVRKN
jgi:hypothetical protein